MREKTLLTAVLGELRKVMPVALLGFNTDNGSVFMNATVRDYCQEAGVEFTRCRQFRKNDQAWVEQKNGAVVRHTAVTGVMMALRPPGRWPRCIDRCAST